MLHSEVHALYQKSTIVWHLLLGHQHNVPGQCSVRLRGLPGNRLCLVRRACSSDSIWLLLIKKTMLGFCPRMSVTYVSSVFVWLTGLIERQLSIRSQMSFCLKSFLNKSILIICKRRKLSSAQHETKEWTSRQEVTPIRRLTNCTDSTSCNCVTLFGRQCALQEILS